MQKMLTFRNCSGSTFIGQMPFLLPNQQPNDEAIN